MSESFKNAFFGLSETLVGSICLIKNSKLKKVFEELLYLVLLNNINVANLGSDHWIFIAFL